MRGITKFSIAAAIIGAGSLLISYIGGPSEAASVDTTRDCDSYAVIRCGTMNANELRAEYDSLNTNKSNGSTTKQSDIPAIFSALGIKRADLNGSFVKGVVYKDGTVRVNGKTVATGAKTAIRNVGGTAISGSSTAKIVSTSRMGSSQEALVRLNANGQFVFAVMTPCGNPVQATNVVPEPPKPAANCIALSQPVITNRTNVAMSSTAAVSNGAKIQSHVFTIHDASGKQINQRIVTTSSTTASTNFVVTAPGSYTAKVVILTSAGRKESTNCQKPFKIQPEKVQPKEIKVCRLSDKKYPVTIKENEFDPKRYSKNPEDCKEKQKPGISIDKKVDGVEHKAVGVNTEFTYQIRVSNTGETDLKDVVVTDNAPNGVTFLSVSDGSIVDNKWTFTIPELKVGAVRDFTITAKVPTYLAGTIKNTVCVDAPSVPGNPDDCDDATVEVPPEPGKIKVCELATKTIVELPDNQQIDESKYSTDLSKCAEEPVTPPELPQTGITDGLLNALGLGALVTASLAYIASRRNGLVG